MTHINIRNKNESVIKKYLVSLNNPLTGKHPIKFQTDDMTSKIEY